MSSCSLSAGMTSLLGSGVYMAAYPLHDVSIHDSQSLTHTGTVTSYAPEYNLYMSSPALIHCSVFSVHTQGILCVFYLTALTPTRDRSHSVC